ncbi:MAG: leucine-rich repeat domain-containing protein [Muribaculaceae bacterium]|nr:leucine-rich repeat domain-containing protein [Muribaculaceae bacterium]
MKNIIAFLIALSASLGALAFTIPGYGETFEKDGILYLVCDTWYQPGGKHLVVINPELIDYLYEESKLFYPENDTAKVSIKYGYESLPPVYTQYYKGDIVIPHSVEYDSVMWPVDWINECAFCGCDSLTSVTLPSSIETIGDWAFAHCPMLRDVEIPDSVVDLGRFIFKGSKSIENYKLPPYIVNYYSCELDCGYINIIFPDNIPILEKGYLPTIYSEAIHTHCKTFTLPKSRFAMYGGCFDDCYEMESVIIPDVECFASVQRSSNDGPFFRCKDLKEIVSMAVIPPQITTKYRDPYGYETRPSQENEPGIKHPRKFIDEEEKDPLEKLMGLAGGLSGVALVVPEGSEQAYAAAPCWSEFNGVRGNFIVGIRNIAQYAESLQLVSNEPDVSCEMSDRLLIDAGEGRLHIRSNAGRELIVRIYDMSGRCVNISTLESSADIALPKGVYIVKAGSMQAKAVVK